MYALLRMLNFSWLGAVIAGTAYQLGGVIGTYVSMGHDGKLFVTAMLPLMMIGLVLGMRRRQETVFRAGGVVHPVCACEERAYQSRGRPA